MVVVFQVLRLSMDRQGQTSSIGNGLGAGGSPPFVATEVSCHDPIIDRHSIVSLSDDDRTMKGPTLSRDDLPKDHRPI